MASSWGNSWGVSWGDSWGASSSGSIVTFFNGVSEAPQWTGVSQPIVHLTLVSPGRYTVLLLSGPENITDSSVSEQTYLIDGLPVDP